MYTVEFEFDFTRITTLDETDSFDDVEAIISDKAVFITQYNPDIEDEQTIYMSFQQLRDMATGLDSEPGAYYIRNITR
jgi:hypothetical protein